MIALIISKINFALAVIQQGIVLLQGNGIALAINRRFAYDITVIILAVCPEINIISYHNQGIRNSAV